MTKARSRSDLRLLAGAALAHAAGRLRHGQAAGKADRDQPQRRHPAGSAGPAAARRRAADPAEPAGLPAEPAARGRDSNETSAVRCGGGTGGRGGAVERPDAGGRRGPAGGAGRRALSTAIWGLSAQPRRRVRSQVSAINIRRRALYSNLAASRGVTPQEVGIAAGCQLLARVQVGQAYMLPDGRWRRRLPGQPAPIPQYCR